MAPLHPPALIHNPGIVLVLTTAPSTEVASQLAQGLVGSGLAACVNFLPAGRSIYRWQGQVCNEEEVVCLIKTQRSQLEALAIKLTALHPYEVPECLVFDAAAASAAYATWISQVTNEPAAPTPA